MGATPSDDDLSESDPTTRRSGIANHADKPPPTSIHWIAEASLARDCLQELITLTAPQFRLILYDSIDVFSNADKSCADVIVYHSQRNDRVELHDLAALALAAPAHAPLVVLSDAHGLAASSIEEIMRHNVSGFIYSRETTTKILLSSLSFVISGGSFIPKTFFVVERHHENAAFFRHREWPPLTPRETEVLNLIRQGKSNKLIAHILNLSPSTTKIHVRNVMHKLGVANRTQAAIEAPLHLRPAIER